MHRAGLMITIPKKLTNGEELVVLTREEYEREVRRSKEIADVLRVIAEGETALREGKTIVASSLREALKRHGKR